MNKQTFNNDDQNLAYLATYFPNVRVNKATASYTGLSGYTLAMTDSSDNRSGTPNLFILQEDKMDIAIFVGSLHECVSYIQDRMGMRYVQ